MLSNYVHRFITVLYFLFLFYSLDEPKLFKFSSSVITRTFLYCFSYIHRFQKIVSTRFERISNGTKRYYSRESVPNTNISIIRAISTSHHLKTGTPIDHSRPTKNPHRITVTLRVARLYPIRRTNNDR